MKVLLIDAYDSFVHIVYQYLLALDLEVEVIRNDQVTPKLIEEKRYKLIVFGPGPGHPSESGYIDLIHYFEGKLPMLGVCLGMQAMVMAYGGEITKAKHIMHGKMSLVDHTNQGLFKGLQNPYPVGRYHSLVADEEAFPHAQLEITARSQDDHYVMGIQHKQHAISGVQFHPESVITENGLELFRNAMLAL